MRIGNYLMAMISNVKKTIYYFKRNGVKKTFYAVKERLNEKHSDAYCFVPIDSESLSKQKSLLEAQGKEEGKKFPLISILVPAYRTKEVFLRELVESLLCQSYPYWELVLADATEDRSVLDVIETYKDNRIHYVKLQENGGISENTNQGLKAVSGDYVGLLDHDDLLTADALFEMYQAIENGNKAGKKPLMIYSDEDKCDGEGKRFYEPNRKEDFNLDLLLSNNYICHFLILQRELMERVGFRKAYDGAQDYDLILRSVSQIMEQKEQEKCIVHVPKVLYHWRCHELSTAENPRSKEYAYEAGRRALQDFADTHQMKGKAVHLEHLGFYRLEYDGAYFESRSDLGAVGGKVIKKGKIVGGRMDEKGVCFYEGLPYGFSGTLHRAVLTQDAYAVDLRCIKVRKECRELFYQTVGTEYTEDVGTGLFDCSTLPKEIDLKEKSLLFGRALRENGYRVLWDPVLVAK